MRPKLTYSELLDALERVAEDRGEDYVYPAARNTCYYKGPGDYGADPRSPARCIFGEVFFGILGIDPAVMAYDSGAIPDVIGEMVDIVGGLSYSQMAALQRIQSAQDRGNRYGTILRHIEAARTVA